MGIGRHLSVDYVREVLDYDPATGVFVWKRLKPRCYRRKVGDVAGYVHRTGYRFIEIEGRAYACHRLAWAYVHGEWPECDIDHIDGVPGNNAIANLRKATTSQNMANARLHKNNTSGHKNVYWEKAMGKWFVNVVKDGVFHRFGYYVDKDEAIRVAAEARVKLHGEFARAS